MFGGEGWLAVYGDGGPGGAQALGLMLRSFARKLSPQAWKWTVLRQTDRQTEDTRVEYHKKERKQKRILLRMVKKREQRKRRDW